MVSNYANTSTTCYWGTLKTLAIPLHQERPDVSSIEGIFSGPKLHYHTVSPPSVPPTDSCITTQRIAVSQAGLRIFLPVFTTGYANVQILGLPGTRHLPAFQVHQPAR